MPGWTVTDLLQHCVRGDALGAHDRRAGQGGEHRAVAPRRARRVVQGEAPSGVPRGARALVDDARVGRPRHARCGPSRRRNRTASFWQRRRSQETSIHRYDAELAAGTPSPLDAALAVDGIDEFLTVFLPRLADNFGDVGDGTVHLHCTDVDGEWLVARRRRRGHGRPREHAKGDVAARGQRVRPLAVPLGRVPADALEVFGDADLLARFRAGDQGLAPSGARARIVSRTESPRPMIDGAVVVTPCGGVVARRVHGSRRASPTR